MTYMKRSAAMLMLLALTACSGSDDSDDSTDVVEDVTSETDTDSTSDDDTSTDTSTDTDIATIGNYKSEFFQQFPISEELVSCTLENGSTTTCYELTFLSNAVGDTEDTGTIGPFCPPDITTARSESGVGIYDGTTNPGFQSIVDAAQGMDADGFDIVDEDGNIRFNDLTSSTDADLSYCLSANFDSSLTLTYLIPTEPELRDEPFELGTIDSIGVGINGIPYKGNPPSVTVAEAGVGGTGSGNIPALDLCGGHPDPSGYYHWHFIPQSMNTVLDSQIYNYTEQFGMTCSNSFIEFDNHSAFAGLAKDGYPLYAAFDLIDGVDTEPSFSAEVDECNGHTHATNEYPDGVYHYHAIAEGAPNNPACLIGSFVERDVTVQ